MKTYKPTEIINRLAISQMSYNQAIELIESHFTKIAQFRAEAKTPNGNYLRENKSYIEKLQTEIEFVSICFHISKDELKQIKEKILGPTAPQRLLQKIASILPKKIKKINPAELVNKLFVFSCHLIN